MMSVFKGQLKQFHSAVVFNSLCTVLVCNCLTLFSFHRCKHVSHVNITTDQSSQWFSFSSSQIYQPRQFLFQPSIFFLNLTTQHLKPYFNSILSTSALIGSKKKLFSFAFKSVPHITSSHLMSVYIVLIFFLHKVLAKRNILNMGKMVSILPDKFHSEIFCETNKLVQCGKHV